MTIFCFMLVGFLLRTSSSTSSGWTILLFFIQTAALEVGPVMPALDWVQWFNLGAASTRRCIAPLTPLQQMLVTLGMPLILVGVLGVIALIHILIRGCVTKNRPPTSSSSMAYRILHSLTAKISGSSYIGCCSSVLLFTYTSVTATCIRALRCVDITDSTSLLFQAPTVDCRSPEYRHGFLPVVYIVVVLYCIGFPLGILVFLWSKRSLLVASFAFDRMNGDSARDITMPSRENDAFSIAAPGDEVGMPPSPSFSARTFHSMRRFQTRFGPCFRMYKEQAWWWTSARLLFRFSYVLAAVLLSLSPATKFAVFSGLSILGGALQEWVAPFEERKWNRLEAGSYLCLVAFSLVLSTTAPPYSPVFQILLFLLIVPYALLLVYFTGKTMWVKLSEMVWGRKREKGAAERGAQGDGANHPSVSSHSVVRFSEIVSSYDEKVHPSRFLAYDSEEEDENISSIVLSRPTSIQASESELENSRLSYRAMES